MTISDNAATLIPDAVRFIGGDSDQRAEDAYFELERIAASDFALGLALITPLAAAVDEDTLDAFGAGFLETFIRTHGEAHPDLVAEAIVGSRHLLVALRAVNSHAIPSSLQLALPAGAPPN